MLVPSKKIGSVIFTVSLLCFVNFIRSGWMIDTSFLPRAFSLTLLLIFVVSFLYRKELIKKITIWFAGLLIFYVWNLLSCFWAISSAEALMQTQLVFIGICVFVFVTFFDDPLIKFVDIFTKTQIVALWASFIAAFLKMRSLEFYDPYQIHPVSMNNNLYAAYLLLSVPLVLWGYSIQKGIWKFISALSISASLFFIVILQSRAAYLGIATSLVFIIILGIFRYRNIITLKNTAAGFFTLALLVAAVWIFYQSLDETRKNAFRSKIAVWEYVMRHNNQANVHRPFKEQVVDSDRYPIPITTPDKDVPVEYYENVNTRLIFWEKSRELIADHPFFGVGTGNWRLNIASVTLPRNPDYTIRNYTYSQPHNEWIAFTAELGIPGLLMVLFIFITPVLIVLFLALFHGKARVPFPAMVLAAFLAGFFVFASFDFPFRRVEHLVLFFALLAFMINRTPFLNNLTLKNEWIPGPRNLFPTLLSVLIISLLIILLRIWGEYNSLKIFRFEKKEDSAVVKYCERARSPFYTMTPNALPVDWFKGVAQFRLGKNEKAMASFRSALRTTPYEVRVLNDYSVSLFSERKTREAINVLKYTMYLDPDFDQAKYNLCAVYFSRMDRDSALYYIDRCRNSQKKTDYIDEIIWSVLR